MPNNNELDKKISIEERRIRVYQLSIRGYTPKSIADSLLLPVLTVRNDLKVLSKQDRSRLSERSQMAVLGEHIRFFQSIEATALKETASADAGSPTRNGFLQTALKAREMVVKLQSDIGFLPKRDDAVDDGDFTIKEVSNRRNDIKKQLTDGGIKKE